MTGHRLRSLPKALVVGAVLATFPVFGGCGSASVRPEQVCDRAKALCGAAFDIEGCQSRLAGRSEAELESVATCATKAGSCAGVVACATGIAVGEDLEAFSRGGAANAGETLEGMERVYRAHTEEAPALVDHRRDKIEATTDVVEETTERLEEAVDTVKGLEKDVDATIKGLDSLGKKTEPMRAR